MIHSENTHLDENEMRVNIGSLVTLFNTSTQQRHHYFITSNINQDAPKTRNAKVQNLLPDDELAKIMLTKMVGDEIFSKHSYVIESIEWPKRS